MSSAPLQMQYSIIESSSYVFSVIICNKISFRKIENADWGCEIALLNRFIMTAVLRSLQRTFIVLLSACTSIVRDVWSEHTKAMIWRSLWWWEILIPSKNCLLDLLREIIAWANPSGMTLFYLLKNLTHSYKSWQISSWTMTSGWCLTMRSVMLRRVNKIRPLFASSLFLERVFCLRYFFLPG